MAGLPPTTASSYSNMLNEKSVSKKALSEDDLSLPQEKSEGRTPQVRGVRSSKAGKNMSTFTRMLSQGLQSTSQQAPKQGTEPSHPAFKNKLHGGY